MVFSPRLCGAPPHHENEKHVLSQLAVLPGIPRKWNATYPIPDRPRSQDQSTEHPLDGYFAAKSADATATHGSFGTFDACFVKRNDITLRTILARGLHYQAWPAGIRTGVCHRATCGPCLYLLWYLAIPRPLVGFRLQWGYVGAN